MKEILLVRHAVAEAPEVAAAGGRGESERRLTKEGRRKAREAFAVLANFAERPAAVYSGPYRRARETADMLAEAFGVRKVYELEILAAGMQPEALGQWLDKDCPKARVALVGHEPDFSRFIGWALCGEARAVIEVKKASAILLRFETLAAAGAELAYALPPAFLRGLARQP